MQPTDLKFDTDLAKFTPRQIEAVKHLESGIKFLLYGGALGGGKSYFLRWYGIRRLIKLAVMGYRNVTAMLACEDYPSLKDRQLSKIPREFPPQIGTMHQDHNEYGRCFILNPEYGSGVLCFRNLDDPSKYQSAEFALILIDELTKNVYDTFTHLRTRLRWPGLPDSECQFIGATNPGGPGHGWVKQLWMDKNFPSEWIDPTDYRGMFAYVPSKAHDNPHLDRAYWAMLDTLPEGIRTAFRDGNWDTFIGQAFPELSEAVHGIDPIWPIPKYAPLYMTYDWGFGKPFSIGWWWVNADGQGIRFAEWYGASGPDIGLRLPDSEIAEGIIRREVSMCLATLGNPEDLTTASWPTHIFRHSGFDCFAKKPDYKGGGQGPTTAETFQKWGIILSPTDSKRETKIRMFRERLRPDKDKGGQPGLLVYKTCRDFFRTISGLVMDTTRPEDVNSAGEDHVYDEAAHFAMARPMSLVIPRPKLTGAAKIIEFIERPQKEGWEDGGIIGYADMPGQQEEGLQGY